MTGSASYEGLPALSAGSAVADLALVSVNAPVRTVAAHVAETTARQVPALEVGVVVLQQHRIPDVVFAGRDYAATLDERQYRRGYGPALEAAATGRTVGYDESSCPAPLEDFRRLAARHGICRVRSWPLQAASQPTCGGSLTVYGDPGREGPDPDDAQFALLLAVASVLVADAVVFNRALLAARQMDQAMQSRAVIEQAKGMIMGSMGCTDQEAFEQLKQISSVTHRKLRDVADSIVRGAGTHGGAARG